MSPVDPEATGAGQDFFKDPGVKPVSAGPPTSSETASAKSRARADPSNMNPERTSTSTGTSTTRISETNGARFIMGLMGVTVVFALVGNEIHKSKKGNPATAAGAVVTEGGKIIIGGFAAATILILIADTGEPGRTFAVGLAGIGAVTALLVYGAPVWSTLSRVIGPGTKAPGSLRSAPTTPTQPTRPGSPAYLVNLAG